MGLVVAELDGADTPKGGKQMAQVQNRLRCQQGRSRCLALYH